ncbi:MAG: hypothetical protein WDZ40_01770 [Candidatus Spechtbacterales bacterium]
MPNDKVTNEDLARMMQNEFSTINEKLDGIKEDTRVLRSEVESIKIKLEDLELRLSQMAPNFEVEDLKKRLSAVEKKLGIS